MKKLLFTPGPVMMSSKIKKIGKNQPEYFRNKEFSKVLKNCEKLLLKIVNAPKNSNVIFLSGSGTLGLEASVLNFLNDSKKANIINGGGFGERFVQICGKSGLKFNEITLKRNQKLDFNEFDKNAEFLYTNAHETSIGRLYDLEKIGNFAKENNMLFIVDAISAIIADEIDLKKQNIDALILSSNKGLALPPGLTMIILSPKAIKNLVKINSLYYDFNLYLNDIKRGQTPFTPPVLIIYQLQARLKEIQKIGIKKCNQKAKSLANYFRKSIKNLPFEIYSKDMSNSMSALLLKNGEKADEFIFEFEKRYNICLTPSGGDLKEKLVRVAHIGHLRKKNFKYLIKCLNEYFRKSK